LALRSCEKDLSQTGAVFSIEESWISKSAVGAWLQGKEGDDLAEVKSLLLQVDQALGSSQCLLMGTLANFTLYKSREILEKSLREESATYKRATTYLRDPGFLAPLKPPF
jgi:hypothetical protein